MSTSGKVILKSNDGETIEVDEAVALELQTIKNAVEDVSAKDAIPLSDVSGKILAKVIEYCKKHVECRDSDKLRAFDADFVKVDDDTLVGIILAADYLKIEGLLDLTCQTMINRKTISTSGKVILRSSDGETFAVDEAVALESQTIKHAVEDVSAEHMIWPRILSKVIECCKEYVEARGAVALESQTIKHAVEDVSAIPVPNVSGKILQKVIEYCKKHVEAHNSDDPAVGEKLWAFNADFVKVDVETLFAIMIAANFLNIQELQDLTCQAVADMMKGGTPEEIKKIFIIMYNLTPEEEEVIRRENQWAFDYAHNSC